jgi:hypothetical protein
MAGSQYDDAILAYAAKLRIWQARQLELDQRTTELVAKARKNIARSGAVLDQTNGQVEASRQMLQDFTAAFRFDLDSGSGGSNSATGQA